MARKNLTTLIEDESIKYRYCLAKLEAVWDSLPQGYLHTINFFGEDQQYHYLPPLNPDKPGTLTYLDKSQQALIDALVFKKKISSDISIIHNNLSLFLTLLQDYFPQEEFMEALEKLMESAEFFIIRRRRCVSWTFNNNTGKRRSLVST